MEQLSNKFITLAFSHSLNPLHFIHSLIVLFDSQLYLEQMPIDLFYNNCHENTVWTTISLGGISNWTFLRVYWMHFLIANSIYSYRENAAQKLFIHGKKVYMEQYLLGVLICIRGEKFSFSKKKKVLMKQRKSLCMLRIWVTNDLSGFGVQIQYEIDSID